MEQKALEPALSLERVPSVEVLQAEAEKVLDTLTPTSVLDDMTLKVVGSLLPNLRGMTVDQRIRILGHLVNMYKKGDSGGGSVNVQIINSMPAPR